MLGVTAGGGGHVPLCPPAESAPEANSNTLHIEFNNDFKARCLKPPGHYVMHTWAR